MSSVGQQCGYDTDFWVKIKHVNRRKIKTYIVPYFYRIVYAFRFSRQIVTLRRQVFNLRPLTAHFFVTVLLTTGLISPHLSHRTNESSNQAIADSSQSLLRPARSSRSPFANRGIRGKSLAHQTKLVVVLGTYVDSQRCWTEDSDGGSHGKGI